MKLFITGTDTNVGKTYISVGLLKGFKNLGYSTLGVKPIASGCFHNHDELYNEDALSLWHNSTVQLHYTAINPFRFAAAIAPHIAAAGTNTVLTAAAISKQTQFALSYPADVHIVEGAGGWFTPLNASETMADFVTQAQLPILLVVDIRLGCLNHAILTAHAIKAAQLHLCGWVANCMRVHIEKQNEIINTLKHWLHAPCLGIIPYHDSPERILNLKALINRVE